MADKKKPVEGASKLAQAPKRAPEKKKKTKK